MITRINKSVKWMACAAFFTLHSSLFTSCSDFLDIEPLNDVVLENYWTEKGDVTSVLYSCYETFEHEDFMKRIGVWGELRSDNFVAGNGAPNEIIEILKENIQPTNPLCNWSKIYEAINRCNTVCYYAPIVQQIDPNYSYDEMKANVAEAVTLRSLAYFYLIRAFRDVPYVTEPSIDDTQEYIVAATPFDEVLNQLIQAMESVKDDAPMRYVVEPGTIKGVTTYDAYKNSSRITRWASYALLADLYLWKGDWDKAIEYSDKVLNYKIDIFYKMKKLDETLTNRMDLVDSIPMLLTNDGSANIRGCEYNEIFGEKNSFESIFELYFRSDQSQQNNYVGDYYGKQSKTHGYLSVPDFIYKEVHLSKSSVFKKYDTRGYEYFDENGYVTKYVYEGLRLHDNDMSSIDKIFDGSQGDYRRRRSVNDANWIIYRLTEMALIKAEALIERGGVDDFEAAWTIINAVNKRALCATKATVTGMLRKTDYIGSKNTMENLVLAERQREFMFEGKRWFDLVRFARRDGNNTRLSDNATQKSIENVNALKIKLADPNIIYFPYAKSELKVNPLLKQNPAYSNSEDTELTR